MFNRIAAIASNTLTEAVRQPVYGIVLVAAAALIGLSPTFAMYTLTDDTKLMADMGLATILLAGLLLAGFSASGVIWLEIERKTVLTVITKPVSTFEFVMGKFIGILLSLACAMYVLILVLLLMVRIGAPETASFQLDWPVTAGLLASMVIPMVIGGCANYFFNKNFASTSMAAAVPIITVIFVVLCFFDKELHFQRFGAGIDWNLAKAGILVCFAVFILGALATALSTRFGTTMNIVLCFAVFMLGLLSDYMFGELAQTNMLARIAHGALPNLQIFWLADALTMDSVIPMSYIGYSLVYAVLYQAAIMCVAMISFGSRELS